MKNKKGWLKILEAFIAVMLVLGVLLVLISKSNTPLNDSSEILNLQKNILNSVEKDPALVSQVLVNNTSGVSSYVNKTKPGWLNYSVQICDSFAACPLNVSSDIIINHEIYASNILIISNSTFYDERQLKLFFWRIN
jgi:hypothetical protein